MPRLTSLFAVALACAAFASLRAQSAPAASVFRAQAENDFFTFWVPPRDRSDDNYTQGAHVSIVTPAAPLWPRLLRDKTPVCGAAAPDAACLATEISFAQDMFTPTIDSRLPRMGQRPYAGWLATTITAHRFEPVAHRALALTVGVTGPASLAGDVQDWFHSIIPGFAQPLGWPHQVPTHLAVDLAYDRELQLVRLGSPEHHVAELVPFAGATAGNFLTEARAGARARLGYGLGAPWLTPIVRARGETMQLFAIGEAGGEAIAHELVLDESTIPGRRQIVRTPLVSQYAVGGGVRIQSLSVEFRAVNRSREYRTGPGHHAWGSITATWR